MKKKRKKHGAFVYAGIALLIIVTVVIMTHSVSPDRASELAALNITPSPTPTATPTPTPTPTPVITPKPTVSATPSATPVLKYVGTTVMGISLLEKSSVPKDNHIYNIMSIIPEDGLPIPKLYQFNYKTPICYFYGGRKTVSSSGCGPACVSMIVAWAKRDYDQTPYTQMYYAAEVGEYYGQGLTVDGLEHMLKLNDIVCWQEEVSEENIIAALKMGRPCVMRMGPGTFTQAGHYIILRGIDSEGRILVNDPNNEEHSSTAYDAALIARQAKLPTFVVVGAIDEQTGVDLSNEEVVTILTTHEPFSGTSIGFGTVLEDASLRTAAGNDKQQAVKLAKGTVLEIVEKTAVSGDDKLWYGVAYDGVEYYIRSDKVAAEWYEQAPDETPEPDATDNPDPETAA